MLVVRSSEELSAVSQIPAEVSHDHGASPQFTDVNIDMSIENALTSEVDKLVVMKTIHVNGKASGSNVAIHDKLLMKTCGIINKIETLLESIIETLHKPPCP